ncbi:MAG: triacylglycerol lipase [Dehalococcoidia bacterium]
MRKLLLVALVALALLGMRPLTSPPSAEASHVDPVLFVHGFTGSSSAWNTMIPRFQADGWHSNQLFAITYNSFQSNATIANQIKTTVNQIRATTGASKVDIVTHSMGGLSTRYYLKNLGGAAFVDDWVSLAGPNHGTIWAWGCAFLTPCLQMTPGSSFLNSLNSVDETPGAVSYGTWWSACDEIITPDESVILTGATNTQTSCLLHSGLLTNLAVYNQVRDFVR